MNENTVLLFNKYAKKYFEYKNIQKVLEIGPDNVPSTFCKLIEDRNFKWDTLDIYKQKGITYIATGEYDYPINILYDIVLSSQVIEHVRKPWIWVKELARICSMGGYVITISPISWPFHESPFDCWRIYPEGMRSLYEEAGLQTILSIFESLDETTEDCDLITIGIKL